MKCVDIELYVNTCTILQIKILILFIFLVLVLFFNVIIPKYVTFRN